MTMLPIHARLLGGIYGLLIGDALGVPYEFHSAAEIPPASAIAFTPPPGFRRSHASVLPGTWSDDGALALVLLQSLLTCERLDLDDLAERMVDWYTTGYMAVDQRVFDVGIQTQQAIRRLQQGVDPAVAGATDEWSNGNGSLMRVLPLALWHRSSDADLVQDAHRQSLLTHGHLRSQVCCALYCLWARYTLLGTPMAWQQAVSRLKTIYGHDSPAYAELIDAIQPEHLLPGQGTGYVVDTLRSARWVMQAPSYEQVVKAAIQLGNDTDTTACVAGGIAGVQYGLSGIPQAWLNDLRGQELVQDLLHRLLAWRDSP